MQRREFIIGASAVTLCAVTGARFAKTSNDKKSFLEGGLFHTQNVYGPSQYAPYQNYANSVAFRWSPESKTFLEVACITPAHDVEPIPDQSERSIAVSKFSNAASLIDWKQKKEVASLVLKNDEYFFGHCGFDAQCEITLIGTGDKGRRGQLHLVDLKSFKIIQSLQIPDGIPHEIIRLNEREFLIGILNTTHRDQPILVLADIQSSKVQYIPIEYKIPRRRLIGHGVEIDDNTLCWSANTIQDNLEINRPSLVFINKKTMEHSIYRFQDLYQEDSISSISFDKTTNYLWLTFPVSKQVILFDVISKKIAQVIQYQFSPRGLGLDVQNKKMYTMARGKIYQMKNKTPDPEGVLVSEITDRFSDHCSWAPGV